MLKRTVYGLPLTPTHLLDELAGESFCVSFGTLRSLGRQLYQAIDLVGDDQILMLDNGAFTAWKSGKQFDPLAFVNWAAPIVRRCPQAVAVVPDVIGGSPQDNAELLHDFISMAWDAGCPDMIDRSMVVWHMDEPLDHLDYLLQACQYLAIGSAGQWSKVGTVSWHARMRDAMRVIDDYSASFHRPWIHLMRAQSQAHLYQVDSSDSCSVAVNHCRYRAEGPGHVRRYADRVRNRIDASCSGVERYLLESPAAAASAVEQYYCGVRDE